MTARKALREATAEKALGEESDIPFNSALHDLAYRLFCIAKRERSTPLMQEAASYWMKYTLVFPREMIVFSLISYFP